MSDDHGGGDGAKRTMLRDTPCGSEGEGNSKDNSEVPTTEGIKKAELRAHVWALNSSTQILGPQFE